MRRNVLALLAALVLGVSGVATAAVFAGTGSPSGGPPGRSDKAEPNEKDAGVHGGPIERFHHAGSCDLAVVGSLPGNWTHGVYVSAVAAGGEAAEIREAAWSDCGKPMVAVGRRRATGARARAHGGRPGARGQGRRLGFGRRRQLAVAAEAQRLRRHAVGPAAPVRDPGVFPRSGARLTDRCCGSRAVVRAAPGGG